MTITKRKAKLQKVVFKDYSYQVLKNNKITRAVHQIGTACYSNLGNWRKIT
jgi:hypothetical protein